MTVVPLPSGRRCAACHALLPARATRCWLCSADVDAQGNTVPLAAALAPFSRPSHAVPSGSFSLASLMLFMTLAAIVCGVFSIAPGVGAVLTLVLIPVVTHTAILARKERGAGNPLGIRGKLSLFLTSLVIVFVAGMASA